MTTPVDLNRLRDLVNSNAGAGRTSPSAPDQRVHVTPSGNVVLGNQADGKGRHLSEVHQGVFSGLPSNDPRKATDDIIEGTAVEIVDRPAPTPIGDRVFLTANGEVQRRADEGRPPMALSEVHQGVFAAAPAAEAAVAREKLPLGARWIQEGTTRGWMYDFTNDLGDDYCFFSYWDTSRSLYMAMMVLPEVPLVPNVHVAHLFASGAVCLSPELGLPTLEACFAKSVIFSIGWSTFVRTGQFPFAGG